MFEGVLDDLDALKVLRFVMNCNDLSKQTDSELAKDLEFSDEIHIQIWFNILFWLPSLPLWSFLVEFIFKYDARLK